MNNEKEKILDMIENGTITAEDGARLLECLGETAEKEKAAEKTQIRSDGERMKGKKLRVDVNGFTEKDQKINVNVSVPLILARYADNIIENCVPDNAMDGLKKNGVDLRSLNISKIVETFETLEEDIINVDIKDPDTDMKVRVYVD